jgi:cytochrome b subunit of formate dehydrogenase
MQRPSHFLPLCVFLIVALSGFAPAASKEFQQLTTFPTGKGPVAIAQADFNHDGNSDIITVNEALSF